jgi:rubrerythrin
MTMSEKLSLRAFDLKALKCPKCGYAWPTKSKLGRTTCPSCGAKVRLK